MDGIWANQENGRLRFILIFLEIDALWGALPGVKKVAGVTVRGPFNPTPLPGIFRGIRW